MDEPTRARIVAALKATGVVTVALLFGAHATGVAHEGSDVDIGFVPRDAAMSLVISSRVRAPR